MTAISLEERRKWIGASESAGLLGLSPWTSRFQLYHEKTGNVPVANLDFDERVMAGRHMEPGIANWANEKWGWDLRKVTTYLAHLSIAGMGCSLDFEEASTGAPVEIKTADYLVFREKWTCEGDVLLDAPPNYLIQVQHQLACRPDAPHGWLVVCVGGNRLYRMKIDRHPALIARIEREVAAFWRDVAAGVEPKPDFGSDLETLGLLYAKGNGGTIDLTASNELPAACKGYLTEAATEKAARTRKEYWLAEIKAALGPNSVGLVQGFIIKAIDVKESVVPATTRRGYRRFDVKEEV